MISALLSLPCSWALANDEDHVDVADVIPLKTNDDPSSAAYQVTSDKPTNTTGALALALILAQVLYTVLAMSFQMNDLCTLEIKSRYK